MALIRYHRAIPMSQTSSVTPVKFVLTSHGTEGSTGQSTGYYLGEVTHPLAELQDAGIPVEFASIQGGESPVDSLELKDAVTARYWSHTTFREAVRHTQPLGQVDASKYADIFFAGRYGAMWDFPGNANVQRVTRDIYEAGGLVNAACHGPAAQVGITLSNGAHPFRRHGRVPAPDRAATGHDRRGNRSELLPNLPPQLADRVNDRSRRDRGQWSRYWPARSAPRPTAQPCASKAASSVPFSDSETSHV